MTDPEIVSLYWKRDESAIKHTQSKYNSYLTRISYNILANLEDCREAVNDTYLAAWNSMPDNRPGVLSTYLGKITRQLSIDIFRKRKSKKRAGSEYAISFDELEEVIASSGEPEKELDSKMLISTISDFLHTLPEAERNLFIGRYYYFDSLKSVAGYCKMSESKAKTLLFRTRQKLKAYLVKEGFIYE